MAKILGYETIGLRERDALQEAARAVAGGSRRGDITPDDGLRVSASVAFTSADLAAIESKRDLRKLISDRMRNTANVGVRKFRAMTVRRDTIDTGLFIKNWSFVVRREGRPFVTSVSFVNPTPYARYIHPKGTPKSATLLNNDIPTVLVDITEDFRADLNRLRPSIARALKADIIARARGARR